MSILSTLIKKLHTGSHTQNDAQDQDKDSYSLSSSKKEIKSINDRVRAEHLEKLRREKERMEEEMGEGEKGNVSEQVGESPLFIRGNPEDGYYLILGSYKVTRQIKWMWQAREIAEQTDWETIMNVIAVMIETAFNIERGTNLTERTKEGTP